MREGIRRYQKTSERFAPIFFRVHHLSTAPKHTERNSGQNIDLQEARLQVGRNSSPTAAPDRCIGIHGRETVVPSPKVTTNEYSYTHTRPLAFGNRSAGVRHHRPRRVVPPSDLDDAPWKLGTSSVQQRELLQLRSSGEI